MKKIIPFIVKITEIKIIPSIIAKFRFPFDVSKAIAVVITRVTPSIFPPTIMTDPTSDNALPVAAKIIVINENFASINNALMIDLLGIPSDVSCSQ